MSRSSEGKYDKILAASIDVISEKGYDKTSISDIVKKAGIAQGTFYLYFPAKNALIPAIADRLLSLTLQEVQEHTQAKESFWEIIDVVVDKTFKITDMYQNVIVLCYSGLAIDHSMEKWEKIYQPYYQWLEDIMSKAIDNNEILSGLNVSWTAKTIINMVENAAERFYINYDQDNTVEVVKTELSQFIKRSLAKS